MNVRDVRPPLTRDCKRNHYAARHGERYLMLECVTAETPQETWIRLGFLESNHAPTKLAYHTVETRASRQVIGALFQLEIARAVAAHGAPNLRDEPHRKAWAGTTRSGAASTLEITLSMPPDVDGTGRIERIYRHSPFVSELLTKRTP